MFDVDFKDIALKILPPNRRKVKLIEFMQSCFAPLKLLNNELLSFRNDIKYKLLFNGQIIYLEHYLNDFYDPIHRRIFIQDVANANYNYLYNTVEGNQVMYLFDENQNKPVYWRNTIEYNSTVHFIIMLPDVIAYNELKMRKEVDVYRQAGKQYLIQTF